MFIASSTCLLLTLIQCVLSDDPVVQTNYGPVRGYTSDIVNGKKANIFLGIPFAKPPVGNLRFEKPKRPEKWTEVVEAKRYSQACFPHHRSAMGDLKYYSEDCLYLNVIAPAEKTHGGYAVMVWIHGGGYNVGSASMFKIDNLTSAFVSRDVIFVSTQYRLGPLGFLTSGDEVMPGNFGLWDQIAALEFVKENIAFFGGDPNRIVIMGLSAGGASTSALALTPHAQNLFFGSIQMSGSVLAEWSSSELVYDASLDLVSQLNCETSDSQTMKNCLKKRTFEEILDSVDKTGKVRNSIKMLKFVPRVDNDFFPEPLETLVKKSLKKPCVIGVTEKEGTMFAFNSLAESINSLYIKPEDFQTYSRKDLIDFIRSRVATEEDFGQNAAEVQAKLIDFYANSADAENSDYRHWLQQYTKLISNELFHIPAMLEAEAKIQNDWPVWLYITDYYNKANYDKDFPDRGATHGIEEMYMFEHELFHLKPFDENDWKMRNVLLDSLTNFVKNGNPSTKEFAWEKATKEHPWRSIRFRPEPVMKEEMFGESYKFWKSLEEYDYNIITGKSRVKNGFTKTEL